MWSVIVDLLHISIHTPRMGSDSQSASDPKALRKYFNPRSPDGERQETNFDSDSSRRISIHAPRMGSDAQWSFGRRLQVLFQSTLPGWGATKSPRQTASSKVFQSTLPGWGATYAAQQTNWANEFQSTLPGWGATGKRARMRSSSSVFQSTLPGWGATLAEFGVCLVAHISIHAPRMGSDTVAVVCQMRDALISIHAPRMGSDPRIVMS